MISEYRKTSAAWAMGAIVFIMDMAAKYLVHANLPLMGYSHPLYPYGGIPVFQNFMGIEFSISHAINKGAAWGVLADYQEYLVAFRIVLISALLLYAVFSPSAKAYRFPFALIIAGAAANIADFFVSGHVVDMLHFVLWGYDYPIFNIADSAIFIGVCWMLIAGFKKKPVSSNRSYFIHD